MYYKKIYFHYIYSMNFFYLCHYSICVYIISAHKKNKKTCRCTFMYILPYTISWERFFFSSFSGNFFPSSKEGHPPPGFALLRDVGVCPRGRSVKEPLRVSGNFAGEERKRKGDMKLTKGIRCKRKKI